MKYRKKPVIIEAWCNTDQLPHRSPQPLWLHKAIDRGDITWIGHGYNIDTLEGVMRADFGDWIIQGVKGEIYPCKPEIFEATYEKVEE